MEQTDDDLLRKTYHLRCGRGHRCDVQKRISSVATVASSTLEASRALKIRVSVWKGFKKLGNAEKTLNGLWLQLHWEGEVHKKSLIITNNLSDSMERSPFVKLNCLDFVGRSQKKKYLLPSGTEEPL
ncbi:hypothetical protein CDAR_550801 [Caerostris darwini]|uniref:LAGLIDADG homing endonuclease n=1 Tax=Caerostris darwini TaxID=1538125 RepID=A0AAV4QKX8_9ARAC|nr:hypothetical protein CDAR_550801 [Caerostris darwini]